MNELYVRLKFDKRDDDEVAGIGFFATTEQVNVIKAVARRNNLFMVVQEEFDFSEEE